MKKCISISLVSLMCLGLISGCANNNVTYANTHKPAQSLSLTYDDFERASLKLVKSMLKSPYLNRMYEIKMKKEGKPLVLMISDFTNDTTQRIDVDQLVKKIRIELLNSGKFIVTTALRAGGPEDKATYELRKLRKNDEFDQSTIAKKHTIIAPDLSLSGKIIQRVTYLDNGKKRVDYYIQMSLTDVRSGLAFWEGEEVVSKIADKDYKSW